MKWIFVLVCATTLCFSAKSRPTPQIQGMDELPGFMARYQKRSTAFSRFRFSTSPSTLANLKTNFWSGQLAAMDSSFMGRPNDALRYFPVVSVTPKATPDAEHFMALDARTWIESQAPAYRVVMINEAHHVPQTRLLTLSLLKPLHDAGFRYLALETLENNGKNPVPGGVVLERSGGYIREPVMADLVREALRLGYTLVPYEAPPDAIGQIGLREMAQARNLAAFLSAHPSEKLLVHAGYAHIAKTDAVRINGVPVMATDLIASTHAKVLSIDQTDLMPMSLASQESIVLQADLAKAFSIVGPVVFLARHGGTPWSSKPSAYDASVLLPPSPSSVIRPDWLLLDGKRRKVYVGAGGCADQFPCLVQAFVNGEPRDAIPADQFVFTVAADERTPLFLRDGAYRLRYTTDQDHVIVDRRIDVPERMGEIGPDRSH